MTCSERPEENLQKAVSKIEEAAKQGAQVVCLQELFRSRYFCQKEAATLSQWAEPIPGRTTEALSPLCPKLGVAVVASLYEKSEIPPSPPFDKGGLGGFNTAIVIDADGTVAGKYRKVHIPDDLKNYYGESFYFQKGDLGYPVCKTRFATVGLQVCYDQWFPEGARALAQAGAQIIFYPTAIGFGDLSPSTPPLLTKERGMGGEVLKAKQEDEKEAWITVQRGHAISNGVFVAACNRVGREDHINFWGTSFVCDPMGRVLGKASADKEETLVVECDLGRIEEVRKDWPFLKEC